MRPLAQMSITEVLRLAGFGHRRSDRVAITYAHDIFRLDTGEVVGQMTADKAYAFACAALAADAAQT
jgi:hypothetical protein